MQSMLKKFRLIGLLEGVSFILLLFIAMPLKYMYGMPEAVKIVGMTHGILFILYVMMLAMAAKDFSWEMKFNIQLFIASLLPFGTFVTDRKLKAYQRA